MASDIVELVLSTGESREKRDPSEWLDLKSRVEEEKFRKLSADLERRRTRIFHQHEEEERKVVQELNNLQRERLRFEREKQLRQRNSFSSSRERRQSMLSEKKSLGEVSTKLPMNEKSFGASASLAFDPTVTRSSRPQRRASREQLTNYGSVRKASKDLSDSNGFPYIDEDDVQRFHKLCKSASKSECRRWGAAWFYAKKEQDVANDAKKRWTSLLLKSEKEKMRVLSAKGVALLDLQSDLTSRDNETISRKVSSGKENESSFDGPKNLSSCRDHEKAGSAGNFRESVELSEEKKLTFHKAFNSGPRECAELAKDKKSTLLKTFSLPQEKKDSRVSRENEELIEDEKLIFHKSLSQRHPSAEDLTKEVEKTGELTPVYCKNITALFKEKGQYRKTKRSKKSRICSGEVEYFKENALLRMPVIHELDAEESSSTSSEISKNCPRRKRAVCFLPNLKNNNIFN